jgi:hypothetical protein
VDLFAFCVLGGCLGAGLEIFSTICGIPVSGLELCCSVCDVFPSIYEKCQAIVSCPFSTGQQILGHDIIYMVCEVFTDTCQGIFRPFEACGDIIESFE